MQCSYFDAGVCGSCSELPTPYDVQLAAKQARARAAVGAGQGSSVEWLAPVTSAERAFRNKAKMVVAGTVAAPTLGILDGRGHGVDLQGCPLYSDALHALFPLLAEFVTRAGLTPYDVPGRTGDLKHVLVTESPDGEVMVRWVLRDEALIGPVREHLSWLLASAPSVVVVSVNVQPDHKAILEGDREVVLTERATLTMRVNGIGLLLRPRSFFQTNTEVAAALYRQVATWVDEALPAHPAQPATVLDLYCGVGGFALHLAAPGRRVLGVEVSAEAVGSATESARLAGLAGVEFRCGDATELAEHERPDLVVVNPPRRGLGPDLCAWLEASSARTLVYSSCHAGSLARDLAALPSWSPRRAQVLDMFPHTGHFELLVLLGRR